jgi:cytochrome c biogenesis factor
MDVADTAYYFKTMTPVGIAVLLLVALFPVYRWNKGVSRPKLLAICGGATLITIITLLVGQVTTSILYLLLFGFSVGALVTNAFIAYQSWRAGNFLPGYLSHVGLALALIGAAASAGFAANKTVNLPQGWDIEAMGYTLRFDELVDTEKGFDCHVMVTRGDETFMAVLPHEFPKNSEGVMKKPHVENYLAGDLYMAPVAIEQPEQQNPGNLALLKGETNSVGPYEVTFHDFIVEGHDTQQAVTTRATAKLTVAREGVEETVEPYLNVGDSAVVPVTVTFDGERASVHIANIDVNTGGVVLTFHGESIPAQDPTPVLLVVELSTKPLISLFWIGTIIAFLAGILSIVKRQRSTGAPAEEAPVVEKEKVRKVA